MSFLPICLNVANAKIAVIGGGKAAEQKLATLLLYAENVFVCAPEINAAIRAMPVTLLQQVYTEDVLEGVRIAYACTNQKQLNRQIAADARRRNILVCVADDPQECDFISPAIYRKGAMSVAVSSNATDVRRSVAWRNTIANLLDDGD
ncbi:MAG: bifunctional precorrin-2 dehydrogenase/sirohydrochlorin ferrochelatase [Acidobacteriota bacterium]|nr:bifunctional precorrin-2 dehydrogenase/sirohydrochlorin ferrochelatase [Acidobacteriota bacterium]